MIDPYLDPASGILRNKLGLTNQSDLDAAEAAITSIRDTELAVNPIPGIYDLTHLRDIHRRLFSDVYDWAGELRTVEIAKGSTQFCFVEHLRTYATDTAFPMIKKCNYLRDLDEQEVARSLATLLGEVNALHPFREGNGRTQRVFFRQMASAAGWRIDWAKAERDENARVCAEAWAGKLAGLEQMLRRLLSPV